MASECDDTLHAHAHAHAEQADATSADQAGVSYVVNAAIVNNNLSEEIKIELGATVGEFVQKVRKEFFLEVKQLYYHNPETKSTIDVTLPSYEKQRIVDLVPPGSTLQITNPQPDGVTKPAEDSSSIDVGTRSSSQTTTAELRTGNRVKVVGLQARPTLNNSVGTLVRWVAGKGRWEVRLDSMQKSDAPLGLKPLNLELVPDEPSRMKGGFLSGGLEDDRSKPRGALIFLCDTGDSGDSFRQKLSDLSGGTFENELLAAGIHILKFPFRKGLTENGTVGPIDWFDSATSGAPAAPEDLAGICESQEQIDVHIDTIVKDSGIPPARIGVAGCGTGGCMCLHLAYGEGRYAGQLGAVACARTALTEDSILPGAAGFRFESGTLPSPPLYMSHGAKDTLVQQGAVLFTHSRLGAAGVQVPEEVTIFPEAAHDLCSTELQEMINFFICHLISK